MVRVPMGLGRLLVPRGVLEAVGERALAPYGLLAWRAVESTFSPPSRWQYGADTWEWTT